LLERTVRASIGQMTAIRLVARMPLPNRVDPFAELFADPARGDLLGNRGGRLHRDDRTLGRRRWVTRAWICCRLAFKDRRRRVWDAGYTELFFLDEPTALSAGHRPCFECRRADARAFALASALASVPRAGEIDRALHAERLDGRAKRRHRLLLDDLPDGAFLADEQGRPLAVRGSSLLVWTPAGYAAREPRPRGGIVSVLTPPTTLRALSNGYRPRWHGSADALCIGVS
jgi:PAS domain-containing protein